MHRPIVSPPRIAALWACAFGLFVQLTAGKAAADFEANDTGWQGISLFVELARDRLGSDRVRAVGEIAWDELRPQDALIVLHPETDLEYREVAAFLAAGGRLALLDDFGSGDRLLEQFRIHRIQAPARPIQRLRNNPALAIAIPSLNRVPGARSEVRSSRHPVVSSADRVVTNHPTALRTEPGLKLTPVLEIPRAGAPNALLGVVGVIGDADRCGLVGGIDEPSQAAPRTVGSCGRLFAMGDPSVVINLMLRYPGNRAFAEGLVDYLVADDSWGRRGGTLYIAANEFDQSGVYGGETGVRRAFEERLSDLRALLRDARRDGLPGPLAVTFGALSALAAAAWTAWTATRIYQRRTPRYARPVPLVAQGGVAGRAAVLSAPTTHRALTVLELKAGLEETLRERLGLGQNASTEHIAEEIDRQRALGRRSSSRLSELFREMRRTETAVATQERIRVTAEDVRRMHRDIKAILSELDEKKT